MTHVLDAALQATLAHAIDEEIGPILFLTGAGISAESGIPTFRGPDGYWKVGSRNYRPEELATHAAFSRMPAEVWSWYLYRRAVCQAATPNAAHRALVELEAAFEESGAGERFRLITQNVDGLHQRAGSRRVWAIHGNIDEMRLDAGRLDGEDAASARAPVPRDFDAWPRERRLTRAELAKLQIEGRAARPHVLWFDETYDEPNFRFESSLLAAAHASLLVVVGTTGATNLPLHIGSIVARQGKPTIVVNPEPNPFSDRVEQTGRGHFLRGTAGEVVPMLCSALHAHLRMG